MTRREFMMHLGGSAALAALPATGHGEAAANPFLAGAYAPVLDELTLDDLPVTGRIPPELDGVYRRNGPNPAFPPLSYTYPFDGDGMIHAARLQNGKASYRNRFVLTPELLAERRAGRALYGGILRPVAPDPALLAPGASPSPFKNFANINVVRHGGRLLALYEAGQPYALGEDLATEGVHDFDGRLKGPMTAHPFLDPVNGEMVFFRYAVARPPFLTLFVADRDGRIVAERAIDTGVPYMIHDFAVTERRIVFVLAPVVFDLAARQQGKPMLAWQPERATRIAVLDRADLHGPIRWCETEPLFLYHFLNAHDDGDAVAIDYVRHDRFALLEGTQAPRLARMVVAGGRVEHTALPSPAVEFPRIDDRRRGLKHRYGYAAVLERGRRGAIARFDAATGAVLLRDFGPGKEVGEPVFAPRAGSADETAGWVMAFVYDHATDRSDFVLLDARDFGGAAAAEIHLPRRVPHGLHGNWMAA